MFHRFYVTGDTSGYDKFLAYDRIRLDRIGN